MQKMVLIFKQLLNSKKINMKATSKQITQLVNKISRLTDNNNHNESTLVLAKLLKDGEAISNMEAIKVKHIAAGGMEMEWINERYTILTRLWDRVLLEYGNVVYQKVKGAF
jgi:hypothetical protein